MDTKIIDFKSESSDKVICKYNLNLYLFLLLYFILVKNFPITSHEINLQNKENLSDLMTTKIDLNPNTNDIDFKIDYTYIESKSMLSFENKIFCKYSYSLIIY